MKTCARCHHRLPDIAYRQKELSTFYPDVEGRVIEIKHWVTSGSVCLACDRRRLRLSRGTQTIHDCAVEALDILRRMG